MKVKFKKEFIEEEIVKKGQSFTDIANQVKKSRSYISLIFSSDNVGKQARALILGYFNELSFDDIFYIDKSDEV